MLLLSLTWLQKWVTTQLNWVITWLQPGHNACPLGNYMWILKSRLHHEYYFPSNSYAHLYLFRYFNLSMEDFESRLTNAKR